MTDAQHTEDPARERLTWPEVCARYPGEWVGMVDAEWIDEDSMDVRTAVVVVHSADYVSSFLGPVLRQQFDASIHVFTGPPGRPSSWAR